MGAAASLDAGATLSALQASTALAVDMQSMFRDLRQKLLDEQQDNERLRRHASTLREALLQSERREAEAESRARVLATRLELEQARPLSHRPGDDQLSLAANGDARGNDSGACLAPVQYSRDETDNRWQLTPAASEQLTPRGSQAEHGVSSSKSERGLSFHRDSDQRSRQRLPRRVWLESDDSVAWDGDSDNDSTPRERAWPSRSVQSGDRSLRYPGREDMLRRSPSATISQQLSPEDDEHRAYQSIQRTGTRLYDTDVDHASAKLSSQSDLPFQPLSPEASCDVIPKSNPCATSSSSPEEVSGSRSARSIQRTSTPSSPSIDFALQDLAAAIAGLEVHLGSNTKPRLVLPAPRRSPSHLS